MLNELENVPAIQRSILLISVRVYSALVCLICLTFETGSLYVDQAILEPRDLPTRIKDVAEVIILLLKIKAERMIADRDHPGERNPKR